MYKITIENESKHSIPQPYFGDWKEIYKPLSNYLKQIIHAENTIGILFPRVDSKYFYSKYQIASSFREGAINITSDFETQINNENHKELNKLGVFCIVSFHNFKRKSFCVCLTWIHLKSMNIIFQHVENYEWLNQFYVQLNTGWALSNFNTDKTNSKALEDQKRIEILIVYKVKSSDILSLIYSFVKDYRYKKKYIKFMELPNGKSMLNQEQISSLWKSD